MSGATKQSCSPDGPWLRRVEAARYAGVSTRTLARWPVPVVRIGRVVLYDTADLDAYLKSRREAPATPRPRHRPGYRPTAGAAAARPRTRGPKGLASELLDLLRP